MKRKKIIRYTVLLLIAAGVVGGWYGYTEYNRKPASMATATPDASVKANELIGAFEKDEPGSNKLYLDKVVEVEGILKESSADESGFYTLSLGDDASMSSVRCSVDSIYTKDAASISKGQTVRIKGVCSGFTADELLGSDVTLVRCAVVIDK